MKTNEDWDFWAKMASAGFCFKYLPKPFFKYRKIMNGQSLSQRTRNETEFYATKIKSQFNPHKEITIPEINKYILNNFKDNKKYIFKLLLIILFPRIFNFFKKAKLFKNDIIIE
ncbi:MAG: hypothetical protein Q4G16_00360 [Cruoricaptor ignavus]|nr:hypothetical protein [Cruoricaptor ignavus]